MHYTTLHHTTPHYTQLHYTTLPYPTLHYITLRYTTLHYISLRSLHHHKWNCNCTTLITLHHNYNSTTLHYNYNYTTPQPQLHHTTLHYNYNYSCTTPHYIQQLWVRRTTRWPLQPLQSLQKTQLQPPFGPSVDSLCHPWFTTTNLSCRFPIFETSATAMCGTTGNNIIHYIIIIYIYTHSICETCKLDTRPIHCIWVWEHPRPHCSDLEPSGLSARPQLIWSAFLQQRSRTLLGFSVCSRKWIRNGDDMDVRRWMEMKWGRMWRVLLGSRLSELWGSHCHEFSPTFEAMAPTWRCIKCSYDSTSYTQELLVLVDIIPRLYHIVMKSNQIVSDHQIIGGMTLILDRDAFPFDVQNPQFLAVIPPFFMAISHF